jgi:hypothetical protein
MHALDRTILNKLSQLASLRPSKSGDWLGALLSTKTAGTFVSRTEEPNPERSDYLASSRSCVL